MKKTCRICKGRGKITTHMPLPMTVICSRCQGTGAVTLPDHIARKLQARRQQRLQEGEQ